MDYVVFTERNGYFGERRKQQAVMRMNDAIIDYLNSSFFNNEEIKLLKPLLEKQLYEGKITPIKLPSA